MIEFFYCVVSKAAHGNAETDNFDRSAVKSYFATLLKRPDLVVKNSDTFANESKHVENAKPCKNIDVVNCVTQLEAPTKQHLKGTAKMVEPTVITIKAGVKRTNTTPTQGPKRQIKLPKIQNLKGTVNASTEETARTTNRNAINTTSEEHSKNGSAKGYSKKSRS